MRLALGTVQFGLAYGIANQAGQVSPADAKAMVDYATAKGFDTIDTAITYGDSEACLGEIGVQHLKVITKLPAIPHQCVDIGRWVREQMVDSIGRLQIKSAYGLMLHRPADLLGGEGVHLYQALQKLKYDGYIHKLGLSIYSPSELEAILPNYSFDLVQAPFNIVDQRIQRTGWLDKLKNKGVEIHTRSSFLQGLLLVPREEIPIKFSKWNDLWDSWSTWLNENCSYPAKVCLDFVQSFDQIDRVVIGADSLSQLEQLVNFANLKRSINFPDIECDDEKLINPVNWAD